MLFTVTAKLFCKTIKQEWIASSESIEIFWITTWEGFNINTQISGSSRSSSIDIRRKHTTRVQLLNWILQLAIVLTFIFFLGVATPHGSITLGLTNETLLKILGQSDAGSYLSAAQDLVNHNSNSPEWEWVLNLWPPGMVWLDALLLKFSPFTFGASFGILLSLVWGTALALLTWPFLRGARSFFIVFVIELLILGTSPFQSWMFDEGILYADGLAAGLLVIGSVLALNSVRAQYSRWAFWARDGIYIGIVFAGAVYLRSSYQALPFVLGLFALIGLVIELIGRKKGESQIGIKHVILLAVATLTIGILLLPYTAYLKHDRDRLALVTTQQLAFQSAWRSLETGSPQWLATAGATIGCDLDRVNCQKFYELEKAGTPASPEELQAAYLEAVTQQPGLFLGLKARYFAQQWFGDEISSSSFRPSTYTKPPYSSNASLNQNVPQGLFYAITMIVTLVGSGLLLFKRRLYVAGVPLLMALAFVAPFAIAHFEVRYLIPLKMLGLLAPLIIVILSENSLFPFKERPIPPLKARVVPPAGLNLENK